MRYATLTLIVVALAATSTSNASTPHSTTFTKITKHDQQVLRFFQHHPRLARTAAGGKALSRVLPRVVGEIRTLEDARAAEPQPVTHERLWKCIAGYPGYRPGGGSGESGGSTNASNGSHFNILQMTNPWAGINPIGMSADSIMSAAESQYAASGYSHSWLFGQWGQTLGPCMDFA